MRVKLLVDGTYSGNFIDITKATSWKGSFAGLDEYKGGKKIVYTIEQGPLARAMPL